MKFFGRQNEIKEFQYRIPGVVDGGHVKLCGIIIQEVQAAVSQWESLATLLQIPAREIDMFKERFKLNL